MPNEHAFAPNAYTSPLNAYAFGLNAYAFAQNEYAFRLNSCGFTSKIFDLNQKTAISMSELRLTHEKLEMQKKVHMEIRVTVYRPAAKVF